MSTRKDQWEAALSAYLARPAPPVDEGKVVMRRGAEMGPTQVVIPLAEFITLLRARRGK